MILKDPRVLILDEATSALDTESERIVQRALEAAHARAHVHRDRPPPVDDPAADVIFVLEAGRVAERGSHDELLAHGGLYARLYDEQFGGGEVEAHCRDGVVLASGRVARPSSAERAGLRVVAGH